MRELLNLNIELSGPVRLGIEGDNVYTSLLYPVKALKDEEYPDMIHFPSADQTYKLAAAWLIEQCGWKAYRKGDVGVNEKQALILVNY